VQFDNFDADNLHVYLKQISKIPLLSQDEVVRYAKQVQRMRHLLELKTDLCSISQEPSLAQWATRARISEMALTSALQGGQRAKRKLIEANLRLVVKIARRYHRQGVDLSDLIQEGTIALSRAVDGFDPARGYKLSTYAYRAIRREISHVVTLKEQAQLLPLGPEQLSPLPLPDETVAQRQQAELVSHLVNQLPPNQQTVVTLLFGLKDGESLSLNQVAEKLGMSRAKVRWAKTKALQALRAESY
jgi:RNA polymerase nonessential primary-like sigma factor